MTVRGKSWASSDPVRSGGRCTPDTDTADGSNAGHTAPDGAPFRSVPVSAGRGERVGRPPLVRYTGTGALVDRATLARLTGRSFNTIRAMCPVAKREGIRPLYDAQVCAAILADKATRNRQLVPTGTD
ncbi:hypothetical protein GCM10010470_00500 [Saccharopolyspora taberi]|uniref:Uncharacterized protein n=1 Tax=Saccharopolyspora taberi TaxID=60895 RepID=A0ABN3UZH9_9PSEU